jgi:hypothetical protein
MKDIQFLIYRLNYVDGATHNLFLKPLRDDRDLSRVFQAATQENFDIVKSRYQAGFQWALRQFHFIEDNDFDRIYAVLTLARSELYRRGAVVTPSGIRDAVSESSPPLADTILLLFDFKRHLFAIQHDYAMMQSDVWRKELESILGRAARSLQFETKLRLEPVPRKEAFESDLRRFERVTRIGLTLRIPNPDIGPTFKRLFEEMAEGGVREFSQVMQNPEGLNLSDGLLPKASLDMALSGYKKGNIKIKGIVNGRSEKLTLGGEVSSMEVEGIRDYVDGIATGSTSPQVKKAMRSILRRIDRLLEHE